jgi:hopanoid C-3 methylase
MNILLYTPPIPSQSIRMDYLISCEPLELEYLFTVLKEQHAIYFLEKGRKAKLCKMIAENNIHLLCISCYITHTPFVLTLAKKLKRTFPKLYITVGGVHAEVVPEHFFSPDIDAVVFGNQLEVIRKIADSLSCSMIPEKTKGAAFRNDDFTMQPPASDPMVYPIPERIILKRNPRKYFYLYFESCVSIKTAQGCPGNCSFCFCCKMNAGIYKMRPIDEVVDEIEGISAGNIFILDDNFLTVPKRIESFCDALEKRDIKKKFIAYGTADFIAQHPRLMDRLKKNGLSALIVGLEYISSTDLQAVHKKATPADNDLTISICHKLDIELFALFICDPDWHHRDFFRLASYIWHKKIRFATFSTPTVFPKTEEAIRQHATFQLEKLWRYDLLRLHGKPANITAFSYYMWLYLLYLLPAMRISNLRHILKRYGWRKGMGAVLKSSLSGAEYFLKLLIWK